MAHVLIVEDDPLIAKTLGVNLDLQGHTFQHAGTLAQAGRNFQATKFQLALVDVGLPDGTGFDFCRLVRAAGSDVPLIILTAQTDEDSVVRGLEAGANDYVKKPFGTRELMARIKACLREPVRSGQLKYLTLALDDETRRVTHDGVEIEMKSREFELLRIFMQRPDVVFTREVLIARLPAAEDISDRTIDSHVSHLRTRLKTAGVAGVRIRAEYGIGYRLTTDD